MNGTAMAAYLGKGGEAMDKAVELLHEGMDPVMALAIGSASILANRGIEAMEAKGQEELVAGDSLPTSCFEHEPAFLAMGFTFGEPYEDDPLFRPATLPAGWKKQGSSHAMHSTIVDEHGRERVGVFFKNAFYDRKADMSPYYAIKAGQDYRYEDPHGCRCAVVLQTPTGPETIFERIWTLPDPDDRYDRYSEVNLTKQGEMVREMDEFLAENYPDHRNPVAYW
jgi:hypothetical protein